MRIWRTTRLVNIKGWSGGAMVLGKLPVPGRPTNLITVGQGPIALTVGTSRGVWTFLLSYILSLLSHSLWETARYRLKYFIKGPLSPKQPTNHVNIKTENTFAGQIGDGDLMNYRSRVVNSSHQQ